MNRRRNPDKGWSHWDIGTREIGILEVVRFGTSEVSKHREDQNQPLAETHGGDRVPSVLRCIRKSSFLWTRDRGNPGQKP
jgi:hypothetical protein